MSTVRLLVACPAPTPGPSVAPSDAPTPGPTQCEKHGTCMDTLFRYLVVVFHRVWTIRTYGGVPKQIGNASMYSSLALPNTVQTVANSSLHVRDDKPQCPSSNGELTYSACCFFFGRYVGHCPAPTPVPTVAPTNAPTPDPTQCEMVCS